MTTMTVGKKIALACAVLVAFTTMLGGVSVLNLSRVSHGVQLLVTDSLPGTYLSGKALALAKDLRGKMLTHIASETEAEMTALELSSRG